jgi:hypothetical protein
VKAAQERAKVIALARAQQAELERRADAIQQAKQQQAFDEMTKGVNRLPDGRIITKAA